MANNPPTVPSVGSTADTQPSMSDAPIDFPSVEPAISGPPNVIPPAEPVADENPSGPQPPESAVSVEADGTSVPANEYDMDALVPQIPDQSTPSPTSSPVAPATVFSRLPTELKDSVFSFVSTYFHHTPILPSPR